jgi:hypothetical protein
MQIFATTGFALMSNPPERATLNVLLRLRLFDSARPTRTASLLMGPCVGSR